MIENGKNYLVEACVAWTNCQEYNYVYGKCSMFDADKEAGFTLRRSENWFIKVKGQKGEVIIPGCRVGTLIRTDEPFKFPPEEELDKHYRMYARVLVL